MVNSYIDLIIRVKNGYLANRETIESPYSGFVEEILTVLKQIGFIKDYQIGKDLKKRIIIDLLYKAGKSVLTDVKIMSKPGRRIYISYKDLKPVLGGFGYSLISTPKGVMTNKQARKEKLGGELLFQIW